MSNFSQNSTLTPGISHFASNLNRSKMLQIYKELDLAVPADVTVSVSSRVFTVKGPRGSLTKVSIQNNLARSRLQLDLAVAAAAATVAGKILEPNRWTRAARL